MPTDAELLHQYARQRDEAAFAEIVRRHADLVYSTALRVAAGEAALAEDATQQVFVKLAEQAGRLAGYDTIVGWLYTTARHRAINAIRAEQHRRAREREATVMQINDSIPETNWTEIGPLLDQAMAHLGEDDRKAVLLRFFKNQSHQEIGAALGLSEDTARKRVERALEKLRGHFARHGVTATAALLASAMSANSVQAAPAGLAAKINPATLAAGRSLAGTHLLMLYLMNTKTKIAAGVAILVALMVGITLQWEQSNKNSPPATGTASPRPPATAPSSPAAKVAAMSPAQVSTPVVPAVAAHQSSAASTDDAVSTTVASGPANADMKTDIPALIHLLEIDDFADIAEYVIPPDEYARAMRGMTREEFGNQLRQELANHGGTEMLLNALRSIQNDEPIMNDAGDQATFKLGAAAIDAQGAWHDEIVFKKVNGLWYGPE